MSAVDAVVGGASASRMVARGGRRARGGWLVAVSAASVSLVLLPLIYLVVRAAEGGGRSVEVATRASSLALAGRSVALACVVATGALLLSGALVWVTAARDAPFRRALTVLAVTPFAAPCYLGASAYLAGTGPRGVIGSAWASLGLGRFPEVSGFWAAALVLILFVYPYAYLPLRSAALRADRSPFDAARTLGKRPWRAAWSGVAPQVMAAAAGGWLFVGLYTLSEFGAVSLLRCDTLTRAVYLEYQSSFDRTAAAVLSLQLVALAGVFVIATDWLGGRGRADAALGRTETPLRWSLGWWRWAGVAASLVVFALSTGVVLVVAASWLRAGGVDLQRSLSAAWSTGGAAVIAATATLIVAWPVAHASARRRGWLARGLERASHLGFALPGVVAALGLAFFALRTPFYQTWAVLILAYVVMFLPQAVSPVRSALGRVSPRTEEAARTLGGSPFAVFRTVTLPQATPGAAAAWLLVLITTARELPATLLLAPTGARTLASELWGAMTEAEYSRAAAPAVGLLVVSGAAVAMVVRRERLAG